MQRRINASLHAGVLPPVLALTMLLLVAGQTIAGSWLLLPASLLRQARLAICAWRLVCAPTSSSTRTMQTAPIAARPTRRRMTVLVKAVTEALCMLAIESLCVARLGYDLFACFCRLLLFLSLCARAAQEGNNFVVCPNPPCSLDGLVLRNKKLVLFHGALPLPCLRSEVPTTSRDLALSTCV